MTAYDKHTKELPASKAKENNQLVKRGLVPYSMSTLMTIVKSVLILVLLFIRRGEKQVKFTKSFKDYLIGMVVT